MTSNGTSSDSPKMKNPEKMTYDKLLSEPEKLRQVTYLLGSQGWEAMELWLQTERQDHLECLAESEDEGERETHRIVAKWIKYFIGTCRESLEAADTAIRHPEPPAETEYMEFDSTSGSPEGPVT